MTQEEMKEKITLQFEVPCADGTITWSTWCYPAEEQWWRGACQEAVDRLANTDPKFPQRATERWLALRDRELRGEAGSLEFGCQYFYDRSGVPPDQRFRRAIELLADYYEYMVHELHRELEEGGGKN